MNKPRAMSTHERRAREARRTRLVLSAFVAGAIAVAALLALALAGGEDDAAPLTTAVVNGTPLPPLPTGAADDPATGLGAPTVEGLAFDGTPVSIADDGRAKAIVFLAHWCPHCRAEVPAVQDWLDGGGLPAGVDLYSVVTASDPVRPNWPPDEWLRREGWTAPVVVDGDDRMAAAYGVSGFPFWTFVDDDGAVVGRWSGELPTAHLHAILERLTAA